MTVERPNLDGVDPAIRAYVAWLELQLMNQPKPAAARGAERVPVVVEPSEPETTMQIITICRSGLTKRTPRHLYTRQGRGGMGVFDIDCAEGDPPQFVLCADEASDLLCVSNLGRAFRIAVRHFPKTGVNGRGQSMLAQLPLLADEHVAAVLKADGGAYLTMVSERGWVQRVNRSYVGPKMLAGQRFHKMSQGGAIVDAAWTTGVDDLFLASRSGRAIRFLERQISGRGGLGMRVGQDDRMVAVTGVKADGAVFMMRENGQGTARLMSGFRQNKAPAAGGKVAMKVERLLGAWQVRAQDDVFAISGLGKMIRFSAETVPMKTGVVQGVRCLSLRADEAAAFCVVPVKKR